VFGVVPAEFRAADHIGPEVVFDRGSDFFAFSVEEGEGGQVIGVNISARKIQAQLVRCLIGGVEAVDVAVRRSTQRLDCVEREARFQAGNRRGDGQVRGVVVTARSSNPWMVCRFKAEPLAQPQLSGAVNATAAI